MKYKQLQASIQLEKVKAHSTLRSLPCIILTTSKNKKDIQEAYSKGASSFIQKPVEFKTFIEKIEALVTYCK